jgi:hypothetical protein
MSTEPEFSLFDIVDLPDSEREIVLHLARSGPADGPTLAEATSLDLPAIQSALAKLVEEGRVRMSAGGQAEVVLGRRKSRTTLPAQLWHALAATDRLYSQRDIATLRTAVPILQFARARLVQFADHGPGHALRVKSFASQLGYIMGLSPTEQQLLRAGALFHDVGNAVDRARHNVISQETVERLAKDGELPFSPKEAELIGILCLWHRREYEPGRVDELGGETVRTGLMASILRVADAMDIDHRRSDYTERFAHVLRMFYAHSLPYWTSLEEILGLRIRCTPDVQLQVFTLGQLKDNIQIAMLRGDLDSTPLDWTIQEIAVSEGLGDNASRLTRSRQRRRPALLVFPFEPHSLIMGALSRAHLTADGHDVELLCYPDTAGGSSWLWGQVMPETGAQAYDRLVVIGDRPDPSITRQLLATTGIWQATGARVSLLNRHEANWSRLPALLQVGVELILGGDWAYFWGHAIQRTDLTWGRIAALCTRDPTQSTVGLTDEERAVTQGLLKVVYDASSQPASDTEGWAALARPILDRIQADDRGYFSGQAGDFDSYAQTRERAHVEGRVLWYDQAPSPFPYAYHWVLERAIEYHGRSPERGIHFNVPYAIATWRDGDEVELLAISHWREEEAIPIRLLYPSHLGPSPVGNESTIQVRLPAAQSEMVIRALVDACREV